MRIALSLITALALAAAVASASSALSDPAYLKAARHICARRAAKLDRLQRFSLQKASTARVARRLRVVTRIYGRGFVRLRRLKPPHDLSFLVPRWLGFERKRLGAWRLGLRAAMHKRPGAARSYAGKADLLGRRAAEISDGLGIPHCE